VLSLLVAMALAQTPPPSKATPPKPQGTGSLASLISEKDYPKESLDRGEQGSVGVLIHIDAAGSVSSCEIKTSSGYPALDTRTCEVIAQRAKFAPARDSEGRAAPGEWQQTVVWRLAETRYPSAPWYTRITLTFRHDGRPDDCRFEAGGGVAPTPQSVSCPSQALPMVLRNHPPLPDGTSMLVTETRFTPGPAVPLTLRDGDVLIGRAVAGISVDATGHVQSCELLEAKGDRAPLDLCKGPLGATYQPRAGSDGKPAPFTATMSATMYAHVGAAAAGSGGRGAAK